MNIFESGLKPDIQNANEGTQRGLGLLDKSIRKLGAGRSILADKHGNIIAGNKTLDRAADIDMPVRIVHTNGDELVVVQRDDLDLYSETDKRARQLAYADNKIAEVDLAWKPEQIAVDFEPLELKEWGFDEGVQGMDGFNFSGLPDEDRAPFRQVTFTLHDSQFEQVESALKISKSLGEFFDSPNENSNGNALSRICEMFIGANDNG